MSITLHAAVVHELVKEKFNPATIKLKDELLDESNESVIALANQIHLALNNKENAAVYGTFRKDGREGKFPSAYAGWLDDKDFLALTTVLMEELKNESSLVGLATGGYIVFLAYSTTSASYVTAAMIKQINAFGVDENLIPQILESLNLKKLHQAIRINENFYRKYQEDADKPEEEKDNYLCFLMANQSDDLAKYFVNAAGCMEGLTSAKATRMTYKTVKDFFERDEELKPYTKQAHEVLTYYFEENQNNAVSLTNIVRSLSKKLFGSDAMIAEQREEHLLKELNSEERRVPAVFYPSKSVLSGKKRVKYKAKGVVLDIEVDIISTSSNSNPVYWNEIENTITLKMDDKFKTDLLEKIPTAKLQSLKSTSTD